MELNKKQMSGIITLSVFLSSMGILIFNPQKTYYCETEDSVKECVRLSSSKMTCYDLIGKGDRCVDGIWKPITEYYIPTETVKVFANNKEWDCEVKDKTVNSYTKCYSDIYETYLGELI